MDHFVVTIFWTLGKIPVETQFRKFDTSLFLPLHGEKK